jgi:hypothetical protein
MLAGAWFREESRQAFGTPRDGPIAAHGLYAPYMELQAGRPRIYTRSRRSLCLEERIVTGPAAIGRREPLDASSRARSRTMLDAILIAAGIGFFVLSIAYVAACERM